MVDELLNIDDHAMHDEYGHEDVLHEEYRDSDSSYDSVGPVTDTQTVHAQAQSQVADHETEVETQVCKEVVVELDHIGQSTTGVQGLNFRGKEPQPVVLESSCDGVPTSTATDAAWLLL